MRCRRTPMSRVATPKAGGGGAAGTLTRCWWECSVVQPLWKTAGRFLTKLNILVTFGPTVVLLGFTQRRRKLGSMQKTAQGGLQQLCSELPKPGSSQGVPRGGQVSCGPSRQLLSTKTKGAIKPRKDVEEPYLPLCK